MNKKMRELLAKIEAKQELAKGYTDGENKDLEKAKAVLEEIDKLKEEYEIEKRIFENEKESAQLNDEDVANIEKNIANKKEDKDEEKSSTKAFATAVKNMVDKTLNEGVAESGGYTVPEDIVTKVERLRETKESLIDLVTVKKVKTNSILKRIKYMFFQ